MRTELSRGDIFKVNSDILSGLYMVRALGFLLINSFVCVSEIFKLENPRVIVREIFFRVPRRSTERLEATISRRREDYPKKNHS